MTGGGTPLRTNPRFWGGDIPWLSSGDIKVDRLSGGSEFITREGLDNSSAAMCPVGSLVLVVRSGILKHSLPVAILDRPAAINQDLRCLDTAHTGLNEWLALAIRAFDTQILERNREGTTVQSVKSETLREWPIPLPPLAEQRRIVERVEELLKRVQVVRQRLARVPVLLKRFRQAVLTAACDGKLTEDWRDNGIADTDSDTDGTESIVPDGWCLSQVNDVCTNVVDCPHSTPKWTDKGDVCLRTTNFRAGQLDVSEVRYVSRETFDKRVARLVPQADDLVYSREGGILGIACLIPIGLKACLGQRMMLMRTDASRCLPAYLMHVLNSPLTNAVVREMTGGTASPHLNVGDIKAFTVPLPPLAEQHEIVRRVEALFKLADTIERRVAAATARADKLTQAILAKAFRGELVPTEAELARSEGRDYETAEQLLARIRAATPPSQGRRRKDKSEVPAESASPAIVALKPERVILDLLLLLNEWKHPVSIQALVPGLILMQHDAARTTLLKGRASRRTRRKVAEPPTQINGLDGLFRTLVANRTIRKVGQNAYELLRPEILKNASPADRRRAAEARRVLELRAENAATDIAEIAHERFKIEPALS